MNAGFRSVGAQTKRVNYNASLSAFQRIGNAQVLRPINMIDLMRESGIYNMQLQNTLMKYLPQYDNITPYGDATPNRDSWILQTAFTDTTKFLNADAMVYNGRETKGEGTAVLRHFSRYEVSVHLDFMKLFAGSKQHSVLSVRYRDDRTTRNTGEKIPNVNLTTQVITVAWDHQWQNNWHFIAGYQSVQFAGMEMQSVKDSYDAIYNFSELHLHGREDIYSAGLKYAFSSRAFLSVQAYRYHTSQQPQTLATYGMNQYMLLYQINF